MKKRNLYRKQKKTNNKKILLAAASVVFVFALAVGGVLLWKHSTTLTADSNKPSFSLDAAKAPAWWTSGSSWPADHNVERYEDSPPLPIVSILAFQGVEGSGDKLNQCFISASYYEGNIDISAALQERQDGMLKGRENSASLSKTGEIPQTIKTSEGDKEYMLHQYDLTPPEGENFQRGNEFGYVKLENGYIYIFGVCPTADMLESTVSAISALEFKL